MKPLLAIQHLSRRFAGQLAVNDISFELHAGEVLGFLGPNGAGKSTTMRMISGGLAPTGGKIEINGIDLLENPLKAKSSLGYLPENPPLYPELTVDEYLRFAGELRKIPKSDLARAVESVKNQCGLSDSGKRLIANLSKGYQQRVGIAQAIIHDPAVVILDEPTNGLDPNQIQEIRSLVRELGKTRGIILCTHILPEVQAACSRVMILHQGQLVFSDDLINLSRTQRNKLLLSLRNPPELQALNELPGVTRASATGPTRFRLEMHEQADAAVIAQQVSANGWQLEEMRWEHEDLQQIFTRLTTSEVAA
jgi:ABC-2 type transport system ATP-binding protein